MLSRGSSCLIKWQTDFGSGLNSGKTGNRFVSNLSCKVAVTLRIACFFASASGSLFSQDAAEIIAKHDDRSIFFGTIYEYDVVCDNVLKDTPLSSLGSGVYKGRRVLTIGHFDSNSYRIPIRIEHFSEQNEPYLEHGEALIFWEAFDGNETRRFNRSLFGDGGARIEHECHVDAGAVGSLLVDDPLRWCLFAMTSANGHFGGVRLPEWKPMPNMAVERKSDKTLGELLLIKDESPSGKLFSTGPEFHLIYADLIGSRIESLTTYGGIRYPSTGTAESKAWHGTFALRSVKPLPQDFDDWFTEWPNGSVVINSIDGSVKRIPYSDIESEKIRKFFDGSAVSDIDIAGRSRGFLFYVNLALLIGIAVVVVMRIRHGRNRQK